MKAPAATARVSPSRARSCHCGRRRRTPRRWATAWRERSSSRAAATPATSPALVYILPARQMTITTRGTAGMPNNRA